MDKIAKALKSLSQKERVIIAEILSALKKGDLKGFDIRKLKGHDNIYRIRKGNLRVIYQIRENTVYLLAVDRRKEGTYKKL